MAKLGVLVGLGLLTASSAVYAEPPSAGTAPAKEPLLGVGYKLGNGIGLASGDIIINPLPHLSLDLQAAYLPDGDGGFALAPSVQGHLFRGRRSSPYVGVGMQYVHLSNGSASASGTGFFGNVGYEFKWKFGLGILLGAGVQHLSKVEATDGMTTVTLGGKTGFNLEAGIRFMFL